MLKAAGSWEARLVRWTPVLLLVLAALYYWSYARYGIDPEDEGELLVNSISVLHGQWPMADFAPSYGPAIYWVLAAAFKTFGATAIIERLYLICVLLVTGQLAYYISRQFLPAPLATIPSVLYFLAPGPWYKAFFIFSLLLAVAGIFAWLRQSHWRNAYLAGVLSGIAFAFRWESGVLALALAVGLAATRGLGAMLGGPTPLRSQKLRSASVFLSCFTAGAATILFGLAVAYWQAGKLAAVFATFSSYYQSYTEAYILMRTNTPWLGINAHLAFILGIAGCAVVLVDGWLRLWRSAGRDPGGEARVLLAASAVAGLAYQWGFWWGERVIQCYVLVYLVWLLIAVTGVAALPTAARAGGVAVLLLAGGAAYASVLGNGYYSGSITALFEPTVPDYAVKRLGGVWPFSRVAHDMRVIADDVSKDQGKSIVPINQAETIAFLTGLPNITRYHALGLFPMSACAQNGAIKLFEQVRPYFVMRRIFWDDTTGKEVTVAHIGAIFAYLRRQYQTAYVGNWYVLVEPRSNTSNAESAVQVAEGAGCSKPSKASPN